MNAFSVVRRTELNAVLNQRLASAVDLQRQLKHAHWSVNGPSFVSLPERFDQINPTVASYVDLLAERIVQLVGIARGAGRVMAAHTRLPEYPLANAKGMAQDENVARAMLTFGRAKRSPIEAANALDNTDTADRSTQVSSGMDKWLWMVEADLQTTE